MADELDNDDRDDLETDIKNEDDNDVNGGDNTPDGDPPPTSTIDPDEFERTRKALARANKEAEQRRHKLREWEELGVDPDKVKTLLEEQKAAERKRMEEEGKYRELLEQLEQTTQEEKRALQEEAEQKLSQMRANVEKYFVDRSITEAIAEEGANSRLLERHVRDQVKVIETEDGDYRTVVVDKDGSPRLKRGGNHMTIKDLLQEMKNDDAFAVAFPAPDTSGAGTSNTSNKRGGDAPPTGIKRGDMSIQERAAYRAKYGKDAYEKLPL